MSKILKAFAIAAGLLVLAGCADLKPKSEEAKEPEPWTRSNLQEPYPI